jgi:hypothetical protein
MVSWFPDREKTADSLSAPLALVHEILHLKNFRENFPENCFSTREKKEAKGKPSTKLYEGFNRHALGGELDERILRDENRIADEMNRFVLKNVHYLALQDAALKKALLEPIRKHYRDSGKAVKGGNGSVPPDEYRKHMDAIT